MACYRISEKVILTPNKVNESYVIPQRRTDDFHVNPREAEGVPPQLQETVTCIICKRYSSGKLLECKKRGHVICEDCHGLINPEEGCIVENGEWGKLQCRSLFWTEFPSKALNSLISTFKFRCLSSACGELIENNGKAWNEHLLNCPQLQKYIQCPSCNDKRVSKVAFVSHCEKTHEVPLNKLDKDEGCVLLLKPGNYKRHPTIRMLFQYEEHLIYIASKNEKPYLRLAAFMVERDYQWASNFKVIITSQQKGSKNMSVALKINPMERDWEDVKIFERSQAILYTELLEIFDEDDLPISQKEFSLHVGIKDPTVIPDVSTWNRSEYLELVGTKLERMTMDKDANDNDSYDADSDDNSVWG